MLLPHEVVDSFIREGELRRMVGDGVPQLIPPVCNTKHAVVTSQVTN